MINTYLQPTTKKLMISEFYNTIKQYKKFNYNDFFKGISSKDIENVINNSKISELEYI